MNYSTARASWPVPRILFVDDSRLMRACAQRILAASCDLVLVETAEQAWQVLQDDRDIQVVFTDINMPGASGYDLLGWIRSSESPDLAELPVVVITGSDGDEDERLHALTLGATDFVSKPFTASELHARTRAYADARRSRQKLRALEQGHHLDAETGLGTRRYCEERLAQAMSFAARHDQELALVHLRLRGLAQLAGNLDTRRSGLMLEQLAQWLGRRMRREDSVFRTGPETFTLILPATPQTGARTLMQRLIPDVSTPGIGSWVETHRIDAEFRLQMLTGADAGEARGCLEEALDNWLPDISEYPFHGSGRRAVDNHRPDLLVAPTTTDRAGPEQAAAGHGEDGERDVSLIQLIAFPGYETR